MASRHSAVTIVSSSRAMNSQQTNLPSPSHSHEHDELSMMFSTSPESSTGLSYPASKKNIGDDGAAAAAPSNGAQHRSQVEWLARAAGDGDYNVHEHLHHGGYLDSGITRPEYTTRTRTSPPAATVKAFSIAGDYDHARSVRLSTFTADTGSHPSLSEPQYALSSHPKATGTSGFLGNLDRDGSTTTIHSPDWSIPSTPASPVVSEPASPPSIASSSSNQRGIRIATSPGFTTRRGSSRGLERMPLRSLDSTFSYGSYGSYSYSTDIASPAMSFNEVESGLYSGTSQGRTSLATDRKGKGKATQVDTLVDSPPPGGSLPSTSFPSFSSPGQICHVHGQLVLNSSGTLPMTTSPDGLGHYSPDVADLLHIPPFELEPRAFDWDEFERSIRDVSQQVETIFHGFGAIAPSPSAPASASASAHQSSPPSPPSEPASTGLGLGLRLQIPTQSSSNTQTSISRSADLPRPLYFPAYEPTTSARRVIVDAPPKPIHMNLTRVPTPREDLEDGTKLERKMRPVSMYEVSSSSTTTTTTTTQPGPSTMASTSSSAYNTEGRETGREATLHERDASSATTRQRVVSISVSIPEGTHLARNRSRSAGSSPKLKKRSLTLPSWLKGRTSGATSPVAVAPPSSVSIPVQATEANSVPKEQSIRARKLFRDKGRTQSVPVSPRFSYLLTADAILQSGSPSVVSEVAEAVNPVVQPVEEVSLFETMLPYEARIGVLAQLVVLHQEEFERCLKSGEWNSVYASQQRWIGKDAGMRELIKLTRVSKSWMALALDGQLWQSFDLKAFPGLAPSLVMKIAQGAGAFVHTLNLQGHTYLKPSSLVAISSSLSLSVEQASPVTQLTTINLVGCATLTNHSLHFLLLRSPNVRNLYLHGLDCVTSATLSDILGPRCPRLVVLDIRRCHHVSASGLSSFAVQCHTRALAERTPCPLKVLKIAGVKGTDVEVMRNVGRAFPRLQVLDASYCRDLTDECFSAFVEWPTTTTTAGGSSAGTEMVGDTGSTLFGNFVELSSREAGLDPGDPSRHLRRITSLRHLNVSGCRHISDKACSNLAYCVPRLEFLEMAAVGGEVKDEGLVRLFRTTKLIKRIDLEDASEITDVLLDALIPAPNRASATQTGSQQAGVKKEEIQPGEMLEHLVISYAALVTPEAMGRLIKGCKRLRIFEADNTRVTSNVLRDFVSRRRHREKTMAVSDGKESVQMGSEIVAIDCRAVSESAIRDLQAYTRPRRGWRGWEARELEYEDGRSVGVVNPLTGVVGGPLIGQDECAVQRVVVKSFHSWVAVDTVAEQRAKRVIKSTQAGIGKDMPRWLTQWSLSRRASSALTPTVTTPEEREDRGCIVQ